jgi:UTP--glucose-1-phosphate uridylyltransferase
MDSAQQSEFGRLLQQAREDAGLTREQLASGVGLDASHLFRIEKGGRRPSRDSALALAVALEVDDATVNRWLVAAGFAPIPAVGALRGSVYARGAARTRGAARSVTVGAGARAFWGASERARRMELMGLTERTIVRVLDAMAKAGLAQQEEAGRSLSGAFAQVAEILESPVRTAVIPAAGWHHRLLAVHVMQELLLGSIREAVVSGICDIILVLAPSGVESLFRPLKQALSLSVAPVINVRYFEQLAPDGLGAAVLLARSAVGGRPFAVLLPDDVVREGTRGVHARDIRRMLRASLEIGDASLVAVGAVSRSSLSRCGVARLVPKAVKDRIYAVAEVAEKPAPNSPILSARHVRGIVGRYVLQGSVFAALAELAERGARPLELTDGLALAMRRGSQLFAYEIETRRADIGAVLDEARDLIEDA